MRGPLRKVDNLDGSRETLISPLEPGDQPDAVLIMQVVHRLSRPVTLLGCIRTGDEPLSLGAWALHISRWRV
jgi:hypothetical protein